MTILLLASGGTARH